jgi:hypothetical protein
LARNARYIYGSIYRGAIAAGAALFAFLSPAHAQLEQESPILPTASNFGGMGLLDMHNARFMPDGYLGLNVNVKMPDDRIALTFQALPWLEATFRYSINYALKPEGQRALYDRSFDLKFRLFEEGEYTPQIAVGFQDVVGTGVYSAEYLVASKEVGPVDLTLGMGWGRDASRAAFPNPLRLISSKFATRPGETGVGGTPLLTDFFRGPDVGLFGGAEYHTPIQNLTLKVEYSSDDYQEETKRTGKNYGVFPVNAGLTYRFWSNVDVGLAYIQGHEISLDVTVAFDATKNNWPMRIDPLPPITVRSEEEVEAVAAALQMQNGDFDKDPWRAHFTNVTVADNAQGEKPADAGNVLPAKVAVPTREDVIAAMRKSIEDQNIIVEGITIDHLIVKVEISNISYLRDAEAISRTLRALSGSAPPAIAAFEITTSVEGMPETTVTIPRTEIDALGRHSATPAEIWASTILTDGDPKTDYPDGDSYPRFQWSIFPSLAEDLFDPDNPTYFGVGLSGSTHVDLLPGLALDSEATWEFYNGFKAIKRTSNSLLPHVRSDNSLYLKQGSTGIDDLTLTYYKKLMSEVYARVTAGYIETMFGGAGGEVLYRPTNERWALDADLFQVYKRDFNDLFGFQNYHILTGHVSLYYQTPVYDLTAVLRGGRYLAGDYGGTFELYRRFKTGILIGAWFTITNVPFSKFGEGSFDKGIRVVIPLEWGVPFGTATTEEVDLRPILRDGGQPLDNDAILYDMTQTSSAGDLDRQWSDVMR